MALKICSAFALFLILNVLLFGFVSACDHCPKPKPPPKPKPSPSPPPPKPKPSPCPPPPEPKPSPCPPSPPPKPKPTPSPPPKPKPTPSPPPKPKPEPNPPHPHPPHPHPPHHKPNNPVASGCPMKLSMCSGVLDGMKNSNFDVPKTPCCSFFHDLTDFEAAQCLCTALKGKVMGVNFDIPDSFTYLLNVCKRQAPRDFLCLKDPHP